MQPKHLKVVGPYRVKNIGVGGNVYEVVEMVDNTSNRWMELRPRYTTTSRQAAYGKCLRLNQRWQDDHQSDEDFAEALAYWRETAN